VEANPSVCLVRLELHGWRATEVVATAWP
jgi:hypothetical protein